MIGGTVVYMWIRLVREHRAADRGPATDQPQDAPAPAPEPIDAAAQPDLLAWQEYLARLHATDSARGPPA